MTQDPGTVDDPKPDTLNHARLQSLAWSVAEAERRNEKFYRISVIELRALMRLAEAQLDAQRRMVL